ncbi:MULTISPECIES: PEP-CTERM sorting domain-containing protein [Sphingobium]|uniref:Cell wall anchor protein n=1 Tax=Sphingobium baderi TaxID=1332080 RepID=A0A0S3F1T9_9SPHN|nr:MULTISPECIES: PEP-CTERM sorting domain-containing protein [Sphingobium]ALR21647.1 cell wall anchor protein [Sphingobium baderi]
MKLNKMLLAAGVAGLVGAATPAQATFGCGWWKQCGGSSGGNSSGGSSSGGATPVPEPEQLGLFAMGIAVLGFRTFRARRKRK